MSPLAYSVCVYIVDIDELHIKKEYISFLPFLKRISK